MAPGNAIRFYRSQQKMTQKELAKATGLSISYLSLIERDKREPSLSTLQKITAGLGVPFVIFILLMDADSLYEINPSLAQKASYAALNYLRNKDK